ncbi:MAG: cytochrome c [Bacteroidia bacterium]|nr:cytochrome c [Bacteroidia bacterium]
MNKIVFGILLLAYLGFSLNIYLTPLSVDATTGYDVPLADSGKLVWQKYNCQSCHQLYSLGGYLGPDLTNILGRVPQEYIQTVIQYGNKQMPGFQMNDTEFKALIEFFKSTNASGNADPRTFKVQNDGMISPKS